ITRNVCRSRQRAVACRPNEVELDPDQLTAATNGDLPSTDDIVGALARMLPNQRTALILRDFRGGAPGEISELLGLTPVGVEALLARARASFREELEAGDQPFDCAETRELVRRQGNGRISVGDRHSLKAHLKHCSPCASTARSLRSSLGKLAGLVWPGGLIERFANLFTQLPTAHVAGAVTSTALVTSVAVPVALTPQKTVSHLTPPAAKTASVSTRKSAHAASQAGTHVRTNVARAKASAKHATAARVAHARKATAGSVARRARASAMTSTVVHAPNAATQSTHAALPEVASTAAATEAQSAPDTAQTVDGSVSTQQRSSEPTTRVRPGGRSAQPTRGGPIRKPGR